MPEQKTKVFIEKPFKHKLFMICEVDENGNKSTPFPIVSMGIKKLSAIVEHIDEARKFVEENKK